MSILWTKLDTPFTINWAHVQARHTEGPGQITTIAAWLRKKKFYPKTDWNWLRKSMDQKVALFLEAKIRQVWKLTFVFDYLYWNPGISNYVKIGSKIYYNIPPRSIEDKRLFFKGLSKIPVYYVNTCPLRGTNIRGSHWLCTANCMHGCDKSHTSGFKFNSILTPIFWCTPFIRLSAFLSAFLLHIDS